MRSRDMWMTVRTVMTVMTALALVTSPAGAETAREKLELAEDDFRAADFAAAREAVIRLLDSGELRGDALTHGWVLRARCELAVGHRAAAEDAFCAVLRLDRYWKPDEALFTRDEMASFEQSRVTCDSDRERATYLPPPISVGTPWYKKKTVLGLVGAAAVAATVIALSGSEDDEVVAELPFFPEAPTR